MARFQLLAVMAASAALAFVAACEPQGVEQDRPGTVGEEAREAGEAIEREAREAGDALEEGARNAAEETREAGDDLEREAREAGDEVERETPRPR